MFKDAVLLLHPIIAISVVFPLMGLIVNRGLQVRQRRLQLASSDKSKVPTRGGTRACARGSLADDWGRWNYTHCLGERYFWHRCQ